MQLDQNSLIADPSTSQIKLVRKMIRNRVMMEYQPELEKAVGLRRNLIEWRLNVIVEIRYRGILCMGAAASPQSTLGRSIKLTPKRSSVTP